jgi:hypothetical protein
MSTIQSNVTGRKLPTRLVCERYGVCDRTIARWQANPDLNFPKPVVINNRKYFDDDEMTAWDRSRAAAA